MLFMGALDFPDNVNHVQFCYESRLFIINFPLSLEPAVLHLHLGSINNEI